MRFWGSAAALRKASRDRFPKELYIKIETENKKNKLGTKTVATAFMRAYAHIEVVVAVLVVNTFGCLVITRYHGVGEVPGYMRDGKK